MPAAVTKKRARFDFTGASAREGAVSLCLAVRDRNPVLIRRSEAGGYNIIIPSHSGEPTEKRLSDFLSDKSMGDFSGVEDEVVSALRSRAGIREGEKDGAFSLVAPQAGGGACSLNVLVESYIVDSRDAVAVTVEADDSDVLPQELLFKKGY